MGPTLALVLAAFAADPSIHVVPPRPEAVGRREIDLKPASRLSAGGTEATGRIMLGVFFRLKRSQLDFGGDGSKARPFFIDVPIGPCLFLVVRITKAKQVNDPPAVPTLPSSPSNGD